MTPKDYEFFAGFVKRFTSGVDGCHDRYGMYLELCRHFRKFDPKFDRDAFHEACEITQSYQLYTKWLENRRLQGEPV